MADTPKRDVVWERAEAYASERAGLREFVERWARTAPALAELRRHELQELDDEAARRMTLDLFTLWRPREFDEMGSGLIEAQQVFVELARLEAERRAGIE